jgi:cytochrome P450
MNESASQDVLRPVGAFKNALMTWFMERLPFVFRLMRTYWPIPVFGKTVVVMRYDDVREVFLNDQNFRVPYREKLNVIMGGQTFFLSMDDGLEYRRDTAAMRKVVLPGDITTRLAPHVSRLAEDIVTTTKGPLEVVDSLVRRVTFEVYSAYFGIPSPPEEDLRLLATRLFEFQFADMGNDPALRSEVNRIAPLLRAHIQDLIDKRRHSDLAQDDVLGRCLIMQDRNEPGFSDDQIRTALMGFIVGGPPQPPMVVPQALNQLLRRPDALEGAQKAACTGDDVLLAGYIFEAMRFDPLAPALPRVATRKSTIAAGSRRAITVPEGANVYVAFSSAMMDERRLPQPQLFNPRRLPHEYIHFGYGLHTCFGIHMNLALLPLMLKPLLKQPGLRRAPGRLGRLRKRGAFAHQLYVDYDRV